MVVGQRGNHGLPAMYLVEEVNNTEKGCVIVQNHFMGVGTVQWANPPILKNEIVTKTNVPVV